MKRIVSGIITALVLAALLIVAAVRSAAPAAETPEQCLEQMFQAMKDGDVSAYLRCFTGELRERLEQNAQEQRNEKFAEYLKETVAPVKGRASYKPEILSTDCVRLKIDRTYERRPWELQAYRLRQESGVWKIYEIEPVELHEPPVPYGTPAFPTPENEPPPDNSKTATR